MAAAIAMFKRRRWLAVFIFLIIVAWLWFGRKEKPSKPGIENFHAALPEKESLWRAPDFSSVPANDSGALIRYGKKLISTTSRYFGPRGSIGQNANGMNCQNCHLDAGTRVWAGNFGIVTAFFPRFSDRRGSFETVNQRISDCFERSMNGRAPDSNSMEMMAMNAYIRWVGKDVAKGKKPPGTGLELPAYINRPADPQKGRLVYTQKCQSCHGANGDGQPDSATGYLYPPLWGEHSYNTAAGLYRLSKFAGFIKDNMPFGSNSLNEQLTNEEAWDLAAFVNSQPRPIKKFRKDWPDISTKPVDLPDGPFSDTFPALQHKYGPFTPIAASKKIKK
jgi:thiosulfate dehydrogenase